MILSSGLFWATLAKACPIGKQTNEQKNDSNFERNENGTSENI